MNDGSRTMTDEEDAERVAMTDGQHPQLAVRELVEALRNLLAENELANVPGSFVKQTARAASPNRSLPNEHRNSEYAR